MAKKKIGIKLQKLIDEDQTLIALKERYFRLMANENIPHTPTLTNNLDKLETTIRERIEELTKQEK